MVKVGPSVVLSDPDEQGLLFTRHVKKGTSFVHSPSDVTVLTTRSERTCTQQEEVIINLNELPSDRAILLQGRNGRWHSVLDLGKVPGHWYRMNHDDVGNCRPHPIFCAGRITGVEWITTRDVTSGEEALYRYGVVPACYSATWESTDRCNCERHIEVMTSFFLLYLCVAT
jgi:hypothetical protein